ncbi:hypothetical protein MRX96_005584 [Rhipicephalus microplus]
MSLSFPLRRPPVSRVTHRSPHSAPNEPEHISRRATDNILPGALVYSTPPGSGIRSQMLSRRSFCGASLSTHPASLAGAKWGAEHFCDTYVLNIQTKEE